MTFSRALSILALSIFLTNVPLLSFAVEGSFSSISSGGSDGGGGGAILCLNPDGSVKSAKLVDLVEAAFYEKYKLSQELSKLTWQKQLAAAVDRISFVDPDFRIRLQSIAKRMPEEMDSYISDTWNTNYYFPTPQDLSLGRTPPIEPGCQIVGAAVFDDINNRLIISHYIWKHLSTIDRAALLLHEAVYKAHRDLHVELKSRDARSSAATRIVVGLAFSTVLDGRPEIKDELAKLEQPGDYRTYVLRQTDQEIETKTSQSIARRKLQAALAPVVPYLLQESSRPLYMDLEGCKEGYVVEVVDVVQGIKRHEWSDKGIVAKKGEPMGRKCELSVQPFGIYGASFRTQPSNSLKPYFKKKTDKNTTVYRFKYDPKNSVLYVPKNAGNTGPHNEKLRLKCSHADHEGESERTPDFTLYCGKQVVAQTENDYWSKQKDLLIYGKSHYKNQPKDASKQSRPLDAQPSGQEQLGEEAGKSASTAR